MLLKILSYGYFAIYTSKFHLLRHINDMETKVIYNLDIKYY